jgi:hypothetical protein
MKFSALALAAALSLVGSVAFAEDVTTTVTLTPNAGVPGEYSGFYGVTHLHAGSFTDTFNFLPPDVAGGVSAALVTIAYTPTTNIDFLSATINGTPFSFSPTGVNEVGFLAQTFMTGPLTLTVTGMAGAGLEPGTDISASYSGTINITPVPEPQTYALLLAGLGVVGFVARRRRSV